VWSKRLAEQEWNAADAAFTPGSGWKFLGDRFESWVGDFAGVKLELRLQKNGQVGLFPEHLHFLCSLAPVFEALGCSKSAAHILNLFAYAGLGSILAARCGATVTHVDLSKTALHWCSQNIALNGVDPKRIRVMAEDAIDFLARENRRKRSYDMLIVDPPSFSRVSKSQEWDLEDVIVQLVADCTGVLNSQNGVLVFSSHHQALNHVVISNLLTDAFSDRNALVESRALLIPERAGRRSLPAGSIVLCRYGEFARISLAG